MGHERDARLLDGIIATPFERRNENHIRIGSHHHLRIEVALHTDLHDAPVFHSLKDIFIEQVLRACQALHHVVGIENGEVRQLQRRHTNGVLDRNANLGIANRHRRLIC